MTLAPEQATIAAHRVDGRHPGHRVMHAQGTLLAGTFTARPVASRLELVNALAPTAASAWRLPRFDLQQDVRARLAREPIRWFLHATLAAPGDPVDDPSREWPAARETVDLGTLELTSVEPPGVHDDVVFDPARVTDGIGLSEDPVLRYRPDAYLEAARERTGTR